VLGRTGPLLESVANIESLLTTYHVPLTTHHVLLTTHRFALRTPHSALSTQHSVLSTQHSALATYHSLITSPHPHPQLQRIRTVLTGRDKLYLEATGLPLVHAELKVTVWVVLG
jgi:hypothetical protein